MVESLWLQGGVRPSKKLRWTSDCGNRCPRAGASRGNGVGTIAWVQAVAPTMNANDITFRVIADRRTWTLPACYCVAYRSGTNKRPVSPSEHSHSALAGEASSESKTGYALVISKSHLIGA